MHSFPESTKFKYPWRSYQERVLKELEFHLEDNHLHIIAPPGSGKTVLGLEVAHRLNKPVLILAPTIAIRNQWILRFTELFLQTEETPEWISRDIKNPSFFTVSTYQGLHAACTGVEIIEEGEEEEENRGPDTKRKISAEKTRELITHLKKQNIGTIVVDEAHHLKKAWWESLIAVKNALTPTIVGLTATPPYDVNPQEWERYITLNGPVDAEISVPELVREGDLCPHQDYVLFSEPSQEEMDQIETFRAKMAKLHEEMVQDEKLIATFQNHPLFANTAQHIEWIYDNIDTYLSLLIYLNAANIPIEKSHMSVMEGVEFTLPELDAEWLEQLLTFYLFKVPEQFVHDAELQERLTNRLKHRGALSRSKVRISDSKMISALLNTSIGKLNSIDHIVDFEQESLKSDLRMVILTDYIRKEYLVSESENSLPLEKIGVVPIFEQLRRTNHRDMKLGILSGSLIVIPTDSLPLLKTIAERYSVTEIPCEPLPYDSNYLHVQPNEKMKHNVVSIITELFQQGGIEVMVGTKSLLGEGWDAPCINSLILATFVGSFVLSNQMRGRAIRTDKNNPEKTGSIWHLVALDPTSAEGGHDMELQRRRFQAFVGVSFESETIVNGFSRLGIPNSIEKGFCSDMNRTMLDAAKDRVSLREKWHKAVAEGSTMKEQLLVPFPKEKSYEKILQALQAKTVKYLLLFLLSSFTSMALGVTKGTIQNIVRAKSDTIPIEVILFIGLAVSFVWFIRNGKLLFPTLSLFLKYRDIGKDIRNIGETLLSTLRDIGEITTKDVTVHAGSEEDGTVYCDLQGGTTYERSLFLTSLQEIVTTPVSPRYLLIRKSTFLELLPQRDYHAIPESIGRNKQNAQLFTEKWQRQVGECELVYSRTTEGKKLLIKARLNSLSAQLEQPCERLERWF